MVAVTVLSSAVTMTDVATIAVSGLSCYYFSVVVTTVQSLAAMAVDVTTSDADANLDRTHKKEECLFALLFFIIIHLLIQRLSTLLHMVQYNY